VRGAGIDIGSRTVKVVLLEDGAIREVRIADAGFDPLDVCRRLLDGLLFDRLVATGYGRHLFQSHAGCEVVTEIGAVARGARSLAQSCRTVIDVGGQDTKVVSLDANGGVGKFAMNDRCAAGTGRFLEVMATAMSFTRSAFVEAALAAPRAERLSSLCTVFAETEVVSLVARGAAREEIALGIHRAIAGRTVALARAVPMEDDIVLAGGGALNACLVREVAAGLGREVVVAQHPQAAAALGCALIASQRCA
jgi:predicted CoA-substrate-specific enzyme activase